MIRQRVDIGNAQGIGDQAAGGAATPRADRNIVILGPVDEIGDDQEVAREPHLLDAVELFFKPGPVFFDILFLEILAPLADFIKPLIKADPGMLLKNIIQ